MTDLDRTDPHRGSTWIAVVVAAIVVTVVLAVVAGLWAEVDAEISVDGWVALVLGVLVALALGIGLMTLVFVSNRRGYDEPDRDRR